METSISFSIDKQQFFDNIYDYEITYDITTGLPKGKIIIEDATGDVLARMEMAIGSEVEISIITETPFHLPNMYISKIFHDDHLSHQKIGGFMIIMLEHKWNFYRDFTPHAYPPMKNSALIEKILEDSTRGVSFKNSKNKILESDDKGSLSRYKTGQSDYDFITKTLLPLSTIKYQPAYFYYDTNGHYNFVNLATQFSDGAFALVTSAEAVSSAQKREVLSKMASSTKSGRTFYGSNFLFRIGGNPNKNLLDKIHPKIYLNDTITHTLLSGIASPTNKMPAAAGADTGNLLPVHNIIMLDEHASSEAIPINRLWDDQMSEIINDSRELDSMFLVDFALTSPPCDAFTVGQAINVYIDKMVQIKAEGDSKQSKTHWLSGNWVVKSITYKAIAPQNTGVKTEVTLIKPTFTITKSASTVTTPELFYSV